MPRQSAAKAQESRRTILRSASRLMRERGYAGAGIDCIMADAGFTPGAFYKHFSSKAALFAAVVEDALAVAEQHLPPIDTAADIEHFIRAYLANKVVRDLGAGCIVAAMSADLARDAAGARAAAGCYIALIQRRIEATLRLQQGEAAQAVAWQLISQLVGAVVIARIVPAELAKAVLSATRSVQIPLISTNSLIDIA
jgi:TetR/AcrR family transcriptional regulator, transcriptional repressor for nem operon